MDQCLTRSFDSKLVNRRLASRDTERKIAAWEIYESDAGEYRKEYDRSVSFYIEAGEAVLNFNSGEIIDIKAGDFVTIEKGAVAHWQINNGIVKKYLYHDSYNSADNRLTQIHWNR
ncbi:MAG: cupin domain-containing protein [Amphritea sp.]